MLLASIVPLIGQRGVDESEEQTALSANANTSPTSATSQPLSGCAVERQVVAAQYLLANIQMLESTGRHRCSEGEGRDSSPYGTVGAELNTPRAFAR